jgi:hypothetical protein
MKPFKGRGSAGWLRYEGKQMPVLWSFALCFSSLKSLTLANQDRIHASVRSAYLAEVRPARSQLNQAIAVNSYFAHEGRRNGPPLLGLINKWTEPPFCEMSKSQILPSCRTWLGLSLLCLKTRRPLASYHVRVDIQKHLIESL